MMLFNLATTSGMAGVAPAIVTLSLCVLNDFPASVRDELTALGITNYM